MSNKIFKNLFLGKKGTETGFTLIELLVVIAIVALLTSVILVSVSSSRIKARNAKRLADVTQLASAFSLYQGSCNAYPQTTSVSLNPSLALFGGTASVCGSHVGTGGNGGIGPISSGHVFLNQFPSASRPADDGSLPVGSKCSEANGSFPWNDFVYTSTQTDKYSLTFCISAQTGSISAGRHTLTESGLR